jgi:signal transduction histidine kinase
MRSPWIDSVQLYAAEVAGAALRHDFGIPLGVVGRNAGFILELLQDGRVETANDQVRSRLTNVCDQVGSLSTEIHNGVRMLGRAIRVAPKPENKQAIFAIQLTYEKINAVVSPSLTELHRHTRTLRTLLPYISSKPVTRYIVDLISNSRRVQEMYSGLHYFFRFDKLDEELFIPVDLESLCSRVAKSVRVVAETSTAIPIAGTGSAECIENQFTLVIQNLLQNAVKFTRHLARPQVEVSILQSTFLELKGRYAPLKVYEARGMWVEIHVKDNGPGVQPDAAQKIFNLYYTKPGTQSYTSGTGMGLAIAKLIVTFHGGLIFLDLESASTDFVVLVPESHANAIDLRLLTKELQISS